MTNNTQRGHRVTTYVQSRIMELIEEKTKDPQIRETYTEFLRQNSRLRNKSHLKIITYENLRELLDALQVSNQEFLNWVNMTGDEEIAWAYPAQAEMSYMLDRMNDEQRGTVLSIIRGIMPKLYMTGINENRDLPIGGSRTTNMLEIIYNESSMSLELFSELGIELRWRFNKNEKVMQASVPHEHMPEIAKRTGISIHWMLNNGQPVLAGCEETEKVMDEFCFLPKHIQDTLSSSLTTAYRAGGVMLG